jgi:threonine dehydrogenase-like Zn-dependent dehydrogenase
VKALTWQGNENVHVTEDRTHGSKSRPMRSHVHGWIGDLMPIVMDDTDPLGTLQLATHYLPRADAPRGYEMFRVKEDGCIKVVLQP